MNITQEQFDRLLEIMNDTQKSIHGAGLMLWLIGMIMIARLMFGNILRPA